MARRELGDEVVQLAEMWLDRSEVTPLVMKESGKDVLNGHCGGGEVVVIFID